MRAPFAFLALFAAGILAAHSVHAGSGCESDKADTRVRAVEMSHKKAHKSHKKKR